MIMEKVTGICGKLLNNFCKRPLLISLVWMASCPLNGSQLVDPRGFWANIQTDYTQHDSKLGRQTIRRIVYLGVGTSFALVSSLVQLGIGLGQWLPKECTLKNDCSILSRLCSSIAQHAFERALSRTSARPLNPWEYNRQLLSQIPVSSREEEKFLHFLQERWLSKVASLSGFAMEWAYPCYDIYYPVHPDATHSYARSLTPRFCRAYTKRVEAWKQSLFHPLYFPLVLTRPGNIQEYLPDCIQVSRLEDIPSLMEIGKETILDVSHLFSLESSNWLADWNFLQEFLWQVCQKSKVDPNRIFCVQRLLEETVGGIRILHLKGQSKETLEQQHYKLLDWLTKCGLAANRVELDRWPISKALISGSDVLGFIHAPTPEGSTFHEEVSDLRNSMDRLRLDRSWSRAPPHKNLMLEGSFQIIEGLLQNISPQRWQEIVQSRVKFAATQLEMAKLTNAFDFLRLKGPEIPYLQFTACLETIHADVSSLLEIFLPFAPEKFASIYRELLYSDAGMPQELKALTSCGIHTSGMTNLAAIVKAFSRPNVLYGENTYFECVNALRNMSNAIHMDKANLEEWKQVDILVEQFNPVLRLEGEVVYRIENIAQNLHKCLELRGGLPLVLALDCTIDFLHSRKMADLLQEFTSQIENGALCVIGFRSGNKFDLFGMDNYCGAPFFVIHNQDPKWNVCASLFTDDSVQADILSVNWFCLAYQFAPTQLELYRKQIFDNTRALLQKVNIVGNKTRVRVSPAAPETDLAFLDVKVFGSLHKLRSAALVAGLFFITSMEEKRPMFNRPSLGFYHPNCTMQFGEANSTIRLTLGLDPAEVELFAGCLESFM